LRGVATTTPADTFVTASVMLWLLLELSRHVLKENPRRKIDIQGDAHAVLVRDSLNAAA
jgi:hypothetical protein